jgi:hypothetical protein
MANNHNPRANRKTKERRRRRELVQAWRRQRERDSDSWLCQCGNWQENGLHCSVCGLEPPWGCWCDEHDEDADGFDRLSDIIGEDETIP